MPLTIASCSALLNAPFFFRYATIASALAGPTLTRTRSMVSTSAVLMLIRSPASAPPDSTSESSSEVKMVLLNAMVRLHFGDGFCYPEISSAGGDSLPGRFRTAQHHHPP